MAPTKNELIESAQRYIQKGQLDKAIREYQQVLQVDSGDIQTRLRLGDLYVRKGNKGEAIQQYLRVAERHAADGFYLKAIAVHKQILKLDPAFVQSLVQLASLYHKQGLLSDAMAHYQMVASLYDKQGMVREALDTLTKMADLDPQNASIRQKLGELYLKARIKESGIEQLLRAAELLGQAGKAAEQLKVLERVVAAEPLHPAANRALIDLLLAMEQPAAALTRISALLARSPDDPDLRELRGDTLLRVGETSEARATYAALLAAHPERLAVRARLIGLLLDAGDLAKADGELAAFEPDRVPIERLDEAVALLEGLTRRQPPPAARLLVSIRRRLAALEQVRNAPGAYEAALAALAGACEAAGDAAGAAAARAELSALRGEPAPPGAAAASPAAGPPSRPPSAPARGAAGPSAAGGEAAPRAAAGPEALPELEIEIDGAPEGGATATPAVVEGPALEGGGAAGPLGYGQIDLDAGLSGDAGPLEGGPQGVRFDDVAAIPETVLDEVTLELAGSVDGEPAAGAAEPTVDGGDLDLLLEAPGAGEAAGVTAGPGEAPAEGDLDLRLEPDEPDAGGDGAGLPLESLTLGEPGAAGPLRALDAAPRVGAAVAGRAGTGAAAADGWHRGGSPESDILAGDEPDLALDQIPEELEEADFFVQQGLLDAARAIYRRILAVDPEHPQARERLAALDRTDDEARARAGAAAEPVAARRAAGGGDRAPAVEVPAETGSFDLAAVLAEPASGDTGLGVLLAPAEQVSFEEVFREFKKGVEQQVGEDPETHYNLGIAYKEMGLLDDAIVEFQRALADPRHTFDCYTMLGLSHLARGDAEAAIVAFQQGLDLGVLEPAQSTALTYELGLAFEAAGRPDEARAAFEAVAQADPTHRDVAARLAALAPPEAVSPEVEAPVADTFDPQSLLEPDDGGAAGGLGPARRETGLEPLEPLEPARRPIPAGASQPRRTAPKRDKISFV